MKTNRIALTATASAAIFGLALSGCSNGEENSEGGQETSASTESSSNDSDSSEQATAEDTEDSGTSGQGLGEDADLSQESPSTTPEAAIKTARGEVEKGTLYSIELDYSDKAGAWQYEVKIKDGNTAHEIEIDAESGEIVQSEKDSSDDKEEAIDLKSPMTYDEGLKLAQKKGQGRLEGWKLEYDDGHIEYQFDFNDNGNEVEVSVDVESKKVLVDD